MGRRAKVGDVFLIIDSPEQVVGHYLMDDLNNGPFMQVYRCPASWSIDKGLSSCEPLFPPVIAGIWHATRTGRWPVLGRAPVLDFTYPQFLMADRGRSGEVTGWWLYDGERERRLGPTVPPELQNLETLTGWPAELLEERIRTGINPLGYHESMARTLRNRSNSKES